MRRRLARPLAWAGTFAAASAACLAAQTPPTTSEVQPGPPLEAAAVVVPPAPVGSYLPGQGVVPPAPAGSHVPGQGVTPGVVVGVPVPAPAEGVVRLEAGRTAEVVEGAVAVDDVVVEGVAPAAPDVPVIPVPGPVQVPPEPLPPRPAWCVPRFVADDDPALLWQRRGPGTTVEVLPRPRESSAAPATPDAPDAATPDAPVGVGTRTGTRALVFDCPAEFPLRRFTSIVQNDKTDGLRVDEGMILRFAPDGTYEVDFNAEVGETPVRLLLQIAFTYPEGRGTLTLPALELDPRRFGRTDGDDNSWHVVFQGRSSLLRQAFAKPGFTVVVERRGVARFGSGVNASRPIFR